MALAQDRTDPRFTVDLVPQTVLGPDGEAHGFTVTEYYRQALLGGLDEISATLTRMARIDAFERDYRAARPWLTY